MFFFSFTSTQIKMRMSACVQLRRQSVQIKQFNKCSIIVFELDLKRDASSFGTTSMYNVIYQV